MLNYKWKKVLTRQIDSGELELGDMIHRLNGRLACLKGGPVDSWVRNRPEWAGLFINWNLLHKGVGTVAAVHQ